MQLGKLKQAWDDLNQAIAVEPILLDAYWHTHMLYLLLMGCMIDFNSTCSSSLFLQLGKLKQAWDDLNQAIALEPMLLDAYWHRHMLYLLRNKPANALQDLNAILKINKEHVGAYRSR